MKHALFSLYYLFIVGVWFVGALAGASTAGHFSDGRAILLMIWMACIYWLPLMIAFHRNTQNAQGVGLVNLLTGWTGIGWLVAFVMAIFGRRH